MRRGGAEGAVPEFRGRDSMSAQLQFCDLPAGFVPAGLGVRRGVFICAYGDRNPSGPKLGGHAAERPSVKAHLEELLLDSIAALRESGELAIDAVADFVIERARNPAHGDFASNAALLLGKAAGRNPRSIAQALVANLKPSAHVTAVEIAGPGFINFRLDPSVLLQAVREAHALGGRYGFAPANSQEPLLVEFVSANPNGPLHVGHGRGAAYGASLANLLEAAGHRVEREYYVNDAGRQMDILAVSVWLRYLEQFGEPVRFPDNGYRGDYVNDIAARLRTKHGEALRVAAAALFEGVPMDEAQGGDKETHVDALIARARVLLGDAAYAQLHDAGLTECIADIRDDLEGFGVRMDRWFSEKSLATSGAIERAVARLREAGHMFEEGGALWFRATTFGDDKDRVVVRENGATTYFASDIAYLLDKLERGYGRALYVLGADHHGYVARLKAAALGLGLDPARVEVLLVQFAILFENGERVQMSTRAGSFVTLRQLREDVGRDAARCFYVLRSHEQHLDFDLDLARSQSNDNPVYYVQYAHARICAVFRQLREKGLDYDAARGAAAAARLVEPQERELLDWLMHWPETLSGAAQGRSPQIVFAALRELAASFHSFYNAVPILGAEDELRHARLYLCEAVRGPLAGGLAMLGASAPETM